MRRRRRRRRRRRQRGSQRRRRRRPAATRVVQLLAARRRMLLGPHPQLLPRLLPRAPFASSGRRDGRHRGDCRHCELNGGGLRGRLALQVDRPIARLRSGQRARRGHHNQRARRGHRRRRVGHWGLWWRHRGRIGRRAAVTRPSMEPEHGARAADWGGLFVCSDDHRWHASSDRLKVDRPRVAGARNWASLLAHMTSPRARHTALSSPHPPPRLPPLRGLSNERD